MQERSLKVLLLPLFLGVAVALGIAIGYFLPGTESAGIQSKTQVSGDKVRDVLQYILDEYVDTLNASQLQDDAITALLSRLDPHSSYIPASELEQMSEQLEGNFDGIGVEFNIQRDTIMVVAAISGGPSEALGIQSGDRIVEIEGKRVAGTNITNEDVMKKLRGKKGTRVKVGIYRPGRKSILPFTITRDKIPIYSVDAAILLDAQTGYIKISRFAATTFEEYLKAYETLKAQGMKQLVLDLRDNPGGYLNAAVDLCDEFLAGGQKIVYTEGKARARENYDATSKGEFESGALVVLIDEGSASASEIVSGAIQDNDRGWVIGKRSFGKGLVQEEVRFDDGSAMRLTIARYYTPSGRCIQRTYENGSEAYYQEIADRMRGEKEKDAGKSHKDSASFKTRAGRVVYGGGGISPDIEVKSDTTGYSEYLANVVSKGLINRFAFERVDRTRKQLKTMYPDAAKFVAGFDASGLLAEFAAFCSKNGVASDSEGQRISAALITQQIEALIARAMYGNEGYFSVQTKHDKTVSKALEVIRSGKTPATSVKK
jgi:carboxyl-terminal processing protease